MRTRRAAPPAGVKSPAVPVAAGDPAPISSTASSVPQQAVVHEPSVPLPPRIELPPERSTSARPVNPWEARWKAAGARLQAERKQPVPPGRPHLSPPVDRYQTVPLKEPSIPLFTRAEAVVPPSRSRQFPIHSLAPTETPGYPASPSLPTRSTVNASPLFNAPMPPAEPSIASAGPDTISPIVQSAEVEKPIIESIDEQAVCDASVTCDETSAAQACIDIVSNPSVDDHSAWFEYYLPEDSSPPAMVTPEPSSAAPDNQFSSLEQKVPDSTSVGQTRQQFVADTSWTATISVLELGTSDVFVSTSTETSGSLPAGEFAHEERPPVTNFRSATLLDRDVLPSDGRQRVSEDKSWPRHSQRARRAARNLKAQGRAGFTFCQGYSCCRFAAALCSVWKVVDPDE